MQKFSQRHPRFWRRTFLKVFTTYGHGGHLGQRTATILAIFIPLPQRGSKWNLNNIGPEAPEEKSFEHVEILNIFPNKCIGKQTWPCRKKVMSMYDHYFSNFGRSPIPDYLCKDSVTRHPWFWRRFLKVFTIYGYGGHLCQWTATILAIFHFPTPGRLQMKFE